MKSSDHYLFFGSRLESNQLLLGPGEAHHARAVLRLSPGQPLMATDGKGSVFSCVIETISKSDCICRIEERKQYPAPLAPVWFFIGLPDRNCFEYALEGLVPLGDSRIIPLECEYCQKGWWKNDWEKHERRFLEKIIAAGKQSRNPFFPSLDAPLSFAEMLLSLPGAVLVADETGQTLEQLIMRDKGPVACLIGPPGGFSPPELEQLKAKKTQFVRLGPYRLRTELAAVTLAARLSAVLDGNEKRAPDLQAPAAG
jgi:16S rRNA (uracil1498-N3)-methyltransferase